MLHLLLLFLGCSGGAKSDDTSTGSGDTDTSADTDTEPACSTVNSGEDWAWHGECPQMTTACEIVVEGCAMTITYSSGMDMGMPYAGTIDGDVVTFEDGTSEGGCTGTVTSADKIEGSCSSGCTFTLRR